MASEVKATENSVTYEGEKEEGKLDEARSLSFEESVRFAAIALDRLIGKKVVDCEAIASKWSENSLNYELRAHFPSTTEAKASKVSEWS